MQVYEVLCSEYEILAVGRHRPLHDINTIAVPKVLLHSIGEHPGLGRLQTRVARRLHVAADPDRLAGLRRALAGRDLLHGAETVLPVTVQGAEIARRNRVQLVLTCWETIPFRYDEQPVLADRKKRVKEAASLYIAVTERARRALLVEGVPPGLVTVVPAGVDCRRFRPRAPSADLLRRWGVEADTPVVLYVGRIIQEKGVVELVRAFAATDPGAHLVLVGSGDQPARVATAAVALGIKDRVHLVPSVPYAQLHEVYATADVVVAPSLPTPYWEEQFGMVLVEAMASGKAVLTTASGAIPEVVGDAAEVVAPYDIDALERGLRHLLQDPKRRAELAAAGRSRALAYYDVPVVARQISDAYQRVLGE